MGTIMEDELKELINNAKKVLEGNWLGNSTKPSPHLYPHQWNWDSGFIAIGYARYDQARAQKELTTLFGAQWQNGMLPQIIFNPDVLGGYFPEPDFWQGERSPHYPEDVLTSGITMPPVHAIAALKIYQHARNGEQAKAWLKDLYPKLLAMHHYFYRERDPHQEGLVFIRHPWESGLDNSPVWDSPLAAIEVNKSQLPNYKRKDLSKGIPASQRPTHDEYDRYVYLVDLFRRLNYDESAIYQECPFIIQDPLLNSILSKSNEDLAEIARIIGEDPGQLSEWHQQTNKALNDKLWHIDHGAYDVYDLVADERIGTITASGFMPLFCGAPTQEQAKVIYKYIESNCFCSMHDGSCFSIPNYNIEGDYFDSKKYWRGPVWINTNWLLMHGLARYGFKDKAESVRYDIIELIRLWGFHEYFDPFKEAGYGTDNFSWTAALFIDVAMGPK